MIDYLTPFEGVVFGGIIALGILSMLSAEENTQTIGAILLAAGFWGGVIALVRALVHKSPGSLYVLSFVGALIAGLVKFFVFPDVGHDGNGRVIWAFIIGIGITGIVGVALNAVIRKPKEDPEEALNQAQQTADRPEEMPAPSENNDDTEEEDAEETEE